MPWLDRGNIPVLPVLRYNWSRKGLRFRINSHTWHWRIPFFGNGSRTINHEHDTYQDRWNHPGPGWWQGRRKRRA
jgi:hypothetical protein